MTDQSWGRAQYMELLDCEGATLVERDEQVMASKELSGELKMRKLKNLRGKGAGKTDQKGEQREDPKGGKERREERAKRKPRSSEGGG